MKYLLILILGFALGFYVDRYQLSRPAYATPSTPGVQTPGPAAPNSLDDKLRQWRLTPDDIRQDLARTGEVVRTQAQAVGEKVSDARILTVIKAKYVLDRDLSACDIHVSVQDRRVTLTGSASSLDLIGRAVALALDTDGVSDVSSKLAIAQH